MLVPSIDRCFPLTAPGTSALATVRFAGRGVSAFVETYFLKPLRTATPTHGELRDARGVIDDPVAVLRDDRLAIDFTFHGGTSILRAVHALAEAAGFVWTVPGEGPWDDASLVGSVDARTVREHEWLTALPFARTERAARVLLAQANTWDRLQASDIEPAEVAAMLDDRSLEHLLTPPTVAIVGLPNAGKSTLANALFGTRRSIVSPLAGTTRDWVGELADLDGLIVTLLDTPGQRPSDDPIERQAIAQSATPIARADLVIMLLDATRDDAEQGAMLDRFPHALRCVNKIDARVAAWSAQRIASHDAVAISASTTEGLDSLIARVHAAFDLWKRPPHAARAWTRRQREVLRALLGAIET